MSNETDMFESAESIEVTVRNKLHTEWNDSPKLRVDTVCLLGISE